MTKPNQVIAYNKVLRVLNSCTNLEQFKQASKMVDYFGNVFECDGRYSDKNFYYNVLNSALWMRENFIKYGRYTAIPMNL